MERKRILVIDGDARDIIASMLTSAGFEVEATAEGAEGLRLYCECGPFDVVLTAVVDSGIDGPKLSEALRQINPKQAMLFTTGSPDVAELVPDSPVLMKPFDKQQLVTFVNEV